MLVPVLRPAHHPARMTVAGRGLVHPRRMVTRMSPGADGDRDEGGSRDQTAADAGRITVRSGL
jgi:hypothetical protein